MTITAGFDPFILLNVIMFEITPVMYLELLDFFKTVQFKPVVCYTIFVLNVEANSIIN